MRAKSMIKATAAAVLAMTGIVSASADTIGVSVGSLSGTTHVGSATQNIAALGGAGSIEYFIPVTAGANGTYGGSGSSCTFGFGTCADSGYGDGNLTMFLRFNPVSTTNPSVLTVTFLDLDLNGANDPAGFLESLQIFSGGTPLTGLITNIGGLVTGDANVQTLTLGLGILTSSPLVLTLKFHSDFIDPKEYGTNTPEHLRATIAAVPGPIVGAGLPGLVLACGGLLALARRRRQRNRCLTQTLSG